MKYKGIIFDLDGTLLDTVDDLMDAVNVTLDEYGYNKIDRDKTMSFLGNGFVKLIEEAANCDSDEKVNKDTLEKMLKTFEVAYDNCYMNKTKAYENVLEVLKKLQQLGIKMAINTNKRQSYAVNLVQKHFGEINFVTLIGEDKNINKKPAKDGAMIILQKMKLERKDVLYVGDSGVDLNTALNAGLDSCFVSWGFRTYEQIKDIKHNYEIDDIRNILKIII